MITAISRGCKGTLTDGVVRYVFDIEPQHAADAAKLFGMPGTSVVLAALTPQAAIKSAQNETIAADKQKRGLLSQWAAMRCDERPFFEFILEVYDKVMGGDGTGHGDIDSEMQDTMTPKEVCRHCILVICDIESRAELDTNIKAAEKFHELIRLPYADYYEDRT